MLGIPFIYCAELTGTLLESSVHTYMYVYVHNTHRYAHACVYQSPVRPADIKQCIAHCPSMCLPVLL